MKTETKDDTIHRLHGQIRHLKGENFRLRDQVEAMRLFSLKLGDQLKAASEVLSEVARRDTMDAQDKEALREKFAALVPPNRDDVELLRAEVSAAHAAGRRAGLEEAARHLEGHGGYYDYAASIRRLAEDAK